MSKAIEAVYPETEHQLCTIHQLRNSLKYVSYKDRKAVSADLKPMYTAATEQEAKMALDSFSHKWSNKSTNF